MNVGFQIKDRFGQIIIATNTYLLSEDMDNIEFGQPIICQFKINLPILSQQYTLNAAVANYSLEANITYDWLDYIGTIQIVNEGYLEQIGLCFSEIMFTKSKI